MCSTLCMEHNNRSTHCVDVLPAHNSTYVSIRVAYVWRTHERTYTAKVSTAFQIVCRRSRERERERRRRSPLGWWINRFAWLHSLVTAASLCGAHRSTFARIKPHIIRETVPNSVNVNNVSECVFRVRSTNRLHLYGVLFVRQHVQLIAHWRRGEGVLVWVIVIASNEYVLPTHVRTVAVNSNAAEIEDPSNAEVSRSRRLLPQVCSVGALCGSKLRVLTKIV